MGRIILEDITPGEFQSMLHAAVREALAEERSKDRVKLPDSIPASGFLTRKDAADRLGVSVSTLDNYIREGLLSKHTAPNGYTVRLLLTEVDKILSTR